MTHKFDDSEKKKQLSSDENFLVTNLLLLTGRENNLKWESIVQHSKLLKIRTAVSLLRDSHGINDAVERCNLLNRLLVSLGVKPAEREFLELIFGNVDFTKNDEVAERVKKFRCLCMLEYGSFLDGYENLKVGFDVRRGKSLRDLWIRYYPSASEICERVKKYEEKAGIAGLVGIPPSLLFCLGSSVREQAKKINIARQRLIELLDDAIGSGVTDVDQLIIVARKHAIENLGSFIVTTGIPGTEKLFQTNLGTPTAPYQSIVKEVRENCVIVSDNDISNARNHGERNLMTYLANLEIDAYIAMRNPLNFISNHAFMTGLFKHGELRDLGVRFFDPTQSFLTNRFQEGLAECLLMKKAEVTIYNAQESGTVYNVREFGRDAEVSVALAEGKPVIIYVPRLFSRQPKFVDFYRIIDNTVEVETFVEELMKFDLLNEKEASTLLEPEKTKADLVVLATKKLEHNLTYLAPNEIQAELITLGYEAPLNRAELITFVVQRIIQLEKRALNFREVNPLSLQASADGVAKGVIVTRSIEDTATVLRGLLLGTLEYDIVDHDGNWTLVDKITRSPVRVVTKNSALTTLFWNAFSEGGSAQPGL